jgi:hypothetical protein
VVRSSGQNGGAKVGSNPVGEMEGGLGRVGRRQLHVSFCNTKRRCSLCSSSFLENIKISSMNTTTNLSKYSMKTLFIRYMK